MNSFVYPTDPAIIDGLVKCIEHMNSTIGESPLVPPPPTREELVHLLQASFTASLVTEEGREISFTVSFFRDHAQEFPYRMKSPLAVSARDLARLAVALDPSRSRICVVPGESDLMIAGLVHLGGHDAFHEIRQTQFEFSIRVLGPGILLIRYGGSLLLTYRQGRFAFHYGDLARINEYTVKRSLSFRSSQSLTPGQSQTDSRFETALMLIARTMLRQRQGGTLLILQEEVDWERTATSKRYLPAIPATIVKEAKSQHFEHLAHRQSYQQQLMQGQLSEEAVSYLVDDAIRARFPSELEWLGRLTTADGMTIILRDFTLLGFGVIFDTREEDENRTRVMAVDIYDEEGKQISRGLEAVGGARHQSAAVCCRRFPDSIAIVASKDGVLSSMKLDQETGAVVVIRHLELLLDV
jgi:hypothetical protein